MVNQIDIQKEFEEKIVQVNRVSKKTKGGNRIGFSVLMVVGNRAGKVGVGLGKAPDVQSAIVKGATFAKKHLIDVPLKGTTIPHEIVVKKGAAKVFLKPAAPGTGVIAGGAVRAVVEAAGIRDILSKVLGTSNQASNVYATLKALQELVLIQKDKNNFTKTEQKATSERERKPKNSKKAKVPAKRASRSQSDKN